ncbi:MAG: DUF2207 domain-containing protein [Betaproteobacteria bacterium]
MRLSVRPLLAVSFAAVLASVPVRADEGWVIDRIAIRYDIQHDGSIVAQEDVDVDFGRLSKHGIFRDIPYLFAWDGTRNREYGITLTGVTTDGRRETVKATTEGAIRRFRIGDPDRTISGRHAYRITYRLDGALNAAADHDELYWNASGVWPVRIERASVAVTAPAGALERAECFQGRAGSTEPCGARVASGEATFLATRPLAVGEQITIVAGLRKGAVPEPRPMLVAKPRTGLQMFDRTPLLLSLMIAGFVAGIGGVSRLWWRIGRDRRYVSLHYLSNDDRQQPVPLFGSDPIVVEFQPPDGIRPAQMGLLFDERADTLDVTATIVDLAVRGYLTITELPKKGWFGKTDWRLDRLKPADAGLLEYERIVLDGLFDAKTSRTLSDLKNSFYKELAKAKDALYKDAVGRGWFPQNPQTVRAIWTGIGFAVAGAGVLLVFYLGKWWGAGLLGFPVAASGALLVPVAKAMPRRTAAGREAMRRSLGFARYIRTAEQHQQAFAERANIFTAYLPYAIAMKCVEKWARAFKDIDLQRATAGWYAGSGRFDPGGFSAGVTSFSSSVSSAIASTPGGSGGSGFSGGSSGGGGGGGGGGSW